MLENVTQLLNRCVPTSFFIQKRMPMSRIPVYTRIKVTMDCNWEYVDCKWKYENPNLKILNRYGQRIPKFEVRIYVPTRRVNSINMYKFLLRKV